MIPRRKDKDAAPAAKRDVAKQVAARLVQDEPALLSSLDFGPSVRQGAGKGPNILIGDQSDIGLFEAQPVGSLDHRMALLARPGDIVVVRQRDRDFERYLATQLGREGVVFLETGARVRSVARDCWSDRALREALTAAIGPAPEVTLTAYLTSGHVWHLAAELAVPGQRTVWVSGPGSRTMRRANDKLWFADLVRSILGRDAVAPTLYAFGPAAASALAARFARQSPHVVVKVPDSAGSAGNVRIDSEALRNRSLADIRTNVLGQLAALGWRGRYPLLVGVWEAHTFCSPSVQMWLPKKDEGPPVVKGVFEQQIRGREGMFSGAVPATLAPEIEARLRQEALIIADVLTRIGYFGFCSLDAVLRVNEGQYEIHWIECNGRWGGVSIPLCAAELIAGGTVPPGLVVLQETRADGPALTMAAIQRRLHPLLLRAGGVPSGLVILSPPALRNGLSINLLSLAESQSEAEDQMTEARILLAGEE